MTLGSIVDAVRRRWVTVVVGAIVGLVVAGAVTMAMPRHYTSTTSIYIAGIDNTGGNQSDYYAASQLVAQRVLSYNQLIVSSRVLGPAGQLVGVPITGSQIATVSQATSAMIGITATESDPGRASAVANAVAARFIEVVGEVERPHGPAGPPSVNAVVVDPAVTPTAPVSPHLGRNLGLGVVLGLIVAIGIALWREVRDDTVRSAEALHQATGAPVWGVLPRHDRAGDRAFGDAVRRVRAFLTATDSPPGVVVVAGASAGAGTTTLAAALGGSLARGRRVLVVDANPRRPALADRFDLPAVPGLTDVLSGTVSADEAVRTSDGPDVPDVLAAGDALGDPGDLLSSPVIAAVLERLRSRYDVVLIDAAPIVPVIETATLARHADGVLVVARDGVTTLPALRTAVATLDQFGTAVVGCVLTAAKIAAPEYTAASVAARPAATTAASGSATDRPSATSTAG